MFRSHLSSLVSKAVQALAAEGKLPPAAADCPIEISDTKGPEFGDYATNFAMAAARPSAMSPRDIAHLLAPKLEADPLVKNVEIAGPGFLNFHLEPVGIAKSVAEIPRLGATGLPSCQNQTENPLHINLEFVSVNPNGPVTVGSARGAAVGDTLARVLQAVGHNVHREFYVNDGINSEQMRLFAEAVRHYLGHRPDMPEGGYKGEYVERVAADAARQIQPDSNVQHVQRVAQELMLERQRQDLKDFGVEFDTWFREQNLHDSGAVQAAIQLIEARGAADRDPIRTVITPDGPTIEPQDPGPLWFRSTQFGDDKDRVLLRTDGRPAYIAADIAYMQNKLGERNFDKALMVLGPDHHGYIGRMNACCLALGYPLDRFQVVIFQIVRFVRDGKPAPMRKRDGNIYELRDLMDEIGADVARFFYLMRSHDTHMDFDIDLATKQSDDNPVYYVQYAHARICSVIEKASETLDSTQEPNLALLTDPRELALIKRIFDLPFEVARCAKDYGVHRLTTYAVELARTYHHFYDACRVIQPDQPELSAARLRLCQAAQIGLQATLTLLSVSAPQRMSRKEE